MPQRDKRTWFKKIGDRLWGRVWAPKYVGVALFYIEGPNPVVVYSGFKLENGTEWLCTRVNYSTGRLEAQNIEHMDLISVMDMEHYVGAAVLTANYLKQ